MDILCLETDHSIRAVEDKIILKDNRVIRNLLLTEEKYVPSPSYFTCLQTDVKEYMRKVVSNWMLEVCEEQRCEDEVFPLSMNYMDRFLSVVHIQRNELQLVGAVCMLIASKLKETSPLTVDKLVQYTDNSINDEEVMSWELLVLNKLKWDLSAVTPNDFLDQLLCRLPLDKDTSSKIRSHAGSFISMTATNFKFVVCPPSMIACGSICAAMNGILGKAFLRDAHILECLHKITSIELECLQECQEQIEQLNSNSPHTVHVSSSSNSGTCGSTTGKEECGQPTTPTDVRDVHY